MILATSTAFFAPLVLSLTTEALLATESLQSQSTSSPSEKLPSVTAKYSFLILSVVKIVLSFAALSLFLAKSISPPTTLSRRLIR